MNQMAASGISGNFCYVSNAVCSSHNDHLPVLQRFSISAPVRSSRSFPTLAYAENGVSGIGIQALKQNGNIVRRWARGRIDDDVFGPTKVGASLRISSSVAVQATVEDSALEVPPGSVSVILLAGGKGKRMGANMPKQYLPLRCQPIALYSFLTFAEMPEVQEIVVVCDPSYRNLFEGTHVKVTVKFALPGKERQDSVHSGLQEINKSSQLVCIHDSARPLVLSTDIRKVLKDALIHGAAVLGVPVKSTIKEANSNFFVTKTLDRRSLWEIQTPQVIEPSLLQRGFELVQRNSLEVTDDVSIIEHLRHPVFITTGSYTNLKVTTPDDIVIAERILHDSRGSLVVSNS